jgi:hypothetical protein
MLRVAPGDKHTNHRRGEEMHRLGPSIALALMCSGCFTTTGGHLAPISPEKPGLQLPIQSTVGDFAMTLEGGKLVTSQYMGRQLNDNLLKVWKNKGYIQKYTSVDKGAFKAEVPYHVTLSGSQYGESSIVMQLVSGLTLTLIPYTVDTKWDVQYTLEDARTGKRYSAGVEESMWAIVDLLLFPALPFAFRGEHETFENMADHLYQQLREQGAFTTDGAEAAPGTAPPPSGSTSP